MAVPAARGTGPGGADPADRTELVRRQDRPRPAPGGRDYRVRRSRSRGRRPAPRPRPRPPNLCRADQPRGHRRLPRRLAAPRLALTPRTQGHRHVPALSRPRDPATGNPASARRFCKLGRGWARITGTVLFGLSAVDTLVGLTTPLALARRLW